MLSIILTIVVGLFIAFFALQNGGLVTVNFAGYTFSDVPLYAVIIGSFLIGIFLAWLASLVNFVSYTFKIFGKDRKIKETNKMTQSLNDKIHALEIENAHLKEIVKTETNKGSINKF